MIDYLDTIPYILLLCLLLFNLTINTRKSNNLCFFILFVFSAIRYDVGFDYMMYLDILRYEPDYDRFEFLEYVLQRFAAQTYIPIFFIVNSFITVYFAKWAIEKLSVNVSVSLLAFLCLPLLYTHSLSIIRFWSGVSVLFYATTFLYEKKWIHFAVLYIISYFIHGSMVVGILFIPLVLFKISRTVNIILLIFSFIGGEFVLNRILGSSLADYGILGQRLNYYVKIATTENGMTKIPYLYLATDILFLILWPRKNNNKSSAVLHKYITIFNIGVCILFLFSFDNTLNSRLCRPFLIYIILVVPLILKHLRGEKRRISTFAFTLAASALFIYTITIYNDTLGKSEYLPYRIIFLENY